MEKSKKIILAALAATSLLAAASGQSLVGSAQADTAGIAQGHITVDHLGRPSVNGVLSQAVIKYSPDSVSSDQSDYLDSLISINYKCNVR